MFSDIRWEGKLNTLKSHLFFWYGDFCFLLIWISLDYLCTAVTGASLEAGECLFCCLLLLSMLFLHLSHIFSNLHVSVCAFKFTYVQNNEYKWVYVSVLLLSLDCLSSVFHSLCSYCACSSQCIYLIMRRAKTLWDNSIFCSNWSFHLRAVLSNLISDKSVSHLQLNYNIELAFRLSSLVLVSSPLLFGEKENVCVCV